MKLTSRKLLALCLFVFAFQFGAQHAVAAQTALTVQNTNKNEVTSVKFIEDYSMTAIETYSNTLKKLIELQSLTNTFIAKPTAKDLELLKTKWIEAKVVYMTSEVYRFYGSPIDGEFGPEGFVNSWPLDEGYIDYVQGNDKAGIINRPDLYPEISKDLLLGLNERNGETNISTGFHAIEFLLWGQDLSATSAGQRSFKDYVAGEAPNAARRKKYLKASTDLLVEALQKVHTEWVETYAKEFADLAKKNPQQALARVFTALIKLSGEELAQERMFVAVDAQSQEDEHSCFSDTTHLDILSNFKGLKKVILGYSKRSALIDLVMQKDPALAKSITVQMSEAEALLKKIPTPFDQAIFSEDGKKKILASVTSLENLSDMLKVAAKLLNVTVIEE